MNSSTRRILRYCRSNPIPVIVNLKWPDSHSIPINQRSYANNADAANCGADQQQKVSPKKLLTNKINFKFSPEIFLTNCRRFDLITCSVQKFGP